MSAKPEVIRGVPRRSSKRITQTELDAFQCKLEEWEREFVEKSYGKMDALKKVGPIIEKLRQLGRSRDEIASKLTALLPWQVSVADVSSASSKLPVIRSDSEVPEKTGGKRPRKGSKASEPAQP